MIPFVLMPQNECAQRQPSRLSHGSEHVNEKQVKALADTEANLLARLIVANARMQSKIYKILSPDQQKRLSDLERTQGAVTSDSR
jgi:hypothetical protein